ncbi:MAG: thermonuclease family protein [bacterium]
MKKIVIISLFLVCISCTPNITEIVKQDCPVCPDCSENKYIYALSSIVDGDSFIMTDGRAQFPVRIAGIDAPEYNQAFGNEAKSKLIKLLKGKKLTFEPVGSGMDFYKRALGHVYANGEDVGLALIKEGLAYYYRPTCKDYPIDKDKYNYDPALYIDAEMIAQKNKRNVWRETNALKPCAFRRKK